MSGIVLPQFMGLSHYSTAGASSVEDIVAKLVKVGTPAACLAEIGNLNSSFAFYVTAKKKGLKPILGIQAIIEDRWSEAPGVIILPVQFKTANAFREMCRWSKRAAERVVAGDDKFPMMEWELLRSLKGQIVVGSGDLTGPIGKRIEENRPAAARQAFNDLAAEFGPDFIPEIQPYESKLHWIPPMYDFSKQNVIREAFYQNNPETDLAPDGDYQKALNLLMLELSTPLGLKPVISLGYQYAEADDIIVQNMRYENSKMRQRSGNRRFIRSGSEILEFFRSAGYIPTKDLVKIFQNTTTWPELFADFKLETSDDRWALPELSVDSMVMVNDQIKRMGRMDWKDPAAVDRLKEEIKVLKNNGKIDVLPYFEPYIKLSNWARERGILTNLRGSAGGSFLIYLLGISNINPMKHGLSFARFISPGRIRANTLPDLDMDVGNRDLFLEYLKSEYGDRVCQISVDVMFKVKSIIKDAERALTGKVSDTTEALCKMIPNPPQGADEYDYVFGYEDDTGHQAGVFDTIPALREYAEKNPTIWDLVKKGLGILRQKSGHACGIVIAPVPIQDLIPITVAGKSIVTGLSPKWVEAAGLVKYDLLGVNTLNDIAGGLRQVKARHGVDLDIFNLPDYKPAYDAIAAGNNATVFQLNTATVGPYLMRIKPKSIDEIANITALCRPGCLDAPAGDGTDRTLAQLYVARAADGEPIAYVHPDMEPILKETYGIMLYQEQQIRVFRDIAGYTEEEAEQVRRAIGKKKEDELRAATDKLKTACLSKGWSQQQSSMLVSQIMAAARYSFNKSHSISYSYVAYACQYPKTRYALEWWTSVLQNADPKELPKFWPSCGDHVLLPSINSVSESFQIEGDKIRAPLSILNGLGPVAYQQILAGRPYHNLRDFVVKTKANGRGVHSGVVTKLIASGLLDPLMPADLSLQDKIYEYMKIKAELEGTRKVDPVPEEYRNLDTLRQFMIKKSLINVISTDLRQLVLPIMGVRPPKNPAGVWVDKDDGRTVAYYIDGHDMDTVRKRMETDQRFRNESDRIVGTISYVIDEKTKEYSGKTKQMTQLHIDTGGTFSEVVVWPAKDATVAETGFKNKIVEIMWRYSASRNEMGVHSIRVVVQ